MIDELDALRPEVREAIRDLAIAARLRPEYQQSVGIIRAELRRLANENFGMHLALSEHDALCEQSTTYRLRAERAQGDCNDLRKRLNDAISERNTIRRERAQEHRKRAREGADLAALKARIAEAPIVMPLYAGNVHSDVPMTLVVTAPVASEWRGKRVRLVVEK